MFGQSSLSSQDVSDDSWGEKYILKPIESILSTFLQRGTNVIFLRTTVNLLRTNVYKTGTNVIFQIRHFVVSAKLVSLERRWCSVWRGGTSSEILNKLCLIKE